MLGTLVLTSKGVAGVPRAVTGDSAGNGQRLSHSGEQQCLIILGVDTLMDMGRTAMNVTGTAWRPRWWRGGKGNCRE